MDGQTLELVKSLSYAFYGICLIVAGLIGALIKLALNIKKTNKEELDAKIQGVKDVENEKMKVELRFQSLEDKQTQLKEEQKKTNAWIDEITGEIKKQMSDGFKEIKSMIRQIK